MCSSAKVSTFLKAPSPIPVGANASNASLPLSLKASSDNVDRLAAQRLNTFLSREPEYQQQIAIDKIRYPSHLIQFRQAINRLAAKQTLKISSGSRALIEDLASSSRILHYPALTLQFRRQHFLYVTKAD